MHMNPLYILSSSCISPQPTFGLQGLDMEVVHTLENSFRCQVPDFTKYINPVAIRRMSRALKVGYTTAVDCLQQQPALIPDAIVIGTGKGCMADTEQFLHSINDYHETALNATHFIHSTYNQLNGMIALNRKINSYNMTYVHRAFSFESALLDAALLFAEEEANTVLAGAFDEMTDEHFAVKKQWGYWKDEMVNSLDLLRSESKGTIAGEGAAFFILGRTRPEGTAIKIAAVQTMYSPSEEKVQASIQQLLVDNDLGLDDIDLFLSGENGDSQYSGAYRQVSGLFDQGKVAYFKHLCGEYDTAMAFVTWLGIQVLKTQDIPYYIQHPDHPVTKQGDLRHVLIYNNYFGRNQSVILLSICP